MGLAAEVREVSFAYGGGAPALAGVSLELAAGETLGLIGANGSGKSTLLKALAGAIAPGTGEVTVAGGRPGGPARGKTAWLPQEQCLDPEMTVAETLRFFAVLQGLGEGAAARCEGLLHAFGLDAVASNLVARCSGGQRQRLHLALGFLPAAEVLLFDEPTQALDPMGREAFWDALKARTSAGAAALLALHDMPEAESRCDRVLVLSGGSLAAEGTPTDLIARHGSWIWSAETAQGSADAGKWTSEIEAAPGVLSARAEPGRLTVRMGPDGPDDAACRASAERHGARIEAYARRRPDLLSVLLAFGNAPHRRTEPRRPGGGRGNGGGRG